jgi:hypothetical protein
MSTPQSSTWRRCREARNLSELARLALGLEERRVLVDPPKALIRTERDAELRLISGEPRGTYDRFEIAMLRLLHRRLELEDSASETMEAYRRSREIIEAWNDCRERQAAEDTRAGYNEALQACGEASDKTDAAAVRLAKTPALSVKGLFAKAKVLKGYFAARRNLLRFGADETSFALALARHVLALAER